MKKYTLILIGLFVFGFAFFAINSGYLNSNDYVPGPEYVTLNEGGFQFEGKPFYPLVLNYMVSVQTDGARMWPSSYKGYGENSYFNYSTHDSCRAEFLAEMEMIKQLGFNSVRIVGIGEQKIDDKLTGLMSIKAHFGNERDTVFTLADSANFSNYLNAIAEVFELCNQAGIKVIFLARMFDEVPATSEHLKKLLIRFRDEKAILAWDLFNEPLYFDSLARDKKDVFYITRKWQKLVDQYAPNHLSTIGLTGIREVFEWDPNLMHMDFLSIHPYEYEPEQVRNEMHWYHRFIKVPWIIGETSLPADNDSVSFEVQNEFARKTLMQTYNCSGIGYSWWQYKDVEWFEFHSNFMGVMSRSGTTQTTAGHIVKGTAKPVANEFINFNPNQPKDSCLCLPNYYNYSEGREYRLKGSLMDEDGNPIEGGVILGWNEHWTKSYHTVTKKDGSFELMGTFPFYHWMASATLHTMIRGDFDPTGAPKASDGIPTFDLGELELKKLKESLN